MVRSKPRGRTTALAAQEGAGVRRSEREPDALELNPGSFTGPRRGLASAPVSAPAETVLYGCPRKSCGSSRYPMGADWLAHIMP
jgi:hypothetical protein